jgi:hypothetical protein
MAKLILANGFERIITPSNGVSFTIEEMQKAVGGYVEVSNSHAYDQHIASDEEGKMKGKQINRKATALYPFGIKDPIVGDVIVGTGLEINGDNVDIDDNGNVCLRTVDEQED